MLETTVQRLTDCRLLGFSVREHIEAWGQLTPEWFVESSVAKAADLESLALEALQEDPATNDLDVDTLDVFLDMITVMGATVEDFEVLVEKQRIDPIDFDPDSE